MPLVKRDFSDHAKVLIMIEEAQDAEIDQRDHVKEAKLFITERDGMWDQDAVRKMDDRFRGTFDMVTPIIDGIAGEIDQADFSLRVSPSGGDASEDTAKTLDGLIRNIRNISNAEDIFNKAGRSNVVGGFDAWEIKQDWIDGDSFDQDLFIKKIPNASDSVWFDLASVEQDRSDANWSVKLVSIPVFDYKARWPEGGEVSVGDNAVHRHRDLSHQKDAVTVGQLYYRKPVTIELVRMTNGAVYRDNEEFKSVKDELAKEDPPVTIEKDQEGNEKRRTRKSWRVWSRMLDGADWLDDEKETVFDYQPIVPIYGNFDIIDNQCIYFGKLENLFDAQRVLNYALSRDIEDGALSPSATTWMTDKQAGGNDYSRMNVDRAPIRIYDTDEQAKTPPFQTGGPQASSGLQNTIANTQQMITSSSNTFNAQQGNASSTQSGIAGLQQIEQGNISNIKWFKALEVAICQTGRVLMSAIPRVYDGTRQARILGEDDSSKMVPLNKTVFDEQSQTNIILNDLSIGEYDVVCKMGPAFKSQQNEAARSFETMSKSYPEMAARNMDILLSNRNEPGMPEMQERERVVLFNGGQIPESQWTDEERQQHAEAEAEAQQQPPQPDPAVIIAQAEQLKGQAEMIQAQTDQFVAQGRQEIEVAKIQIQQQEIELALAKFQRENEDKFNVAAAKIDQGQQQLDQQSQQMVINAQQEEDKLFLQAQKQAADDQAQQFAAFMESQKLQSEQFSAAVNDLKVLREAMGVDAIIGPHTTEAVINQAVAVTEAQEQQGVDTSIGEAVTGSVEASEAVTGESVDNES